MNNTSKQSLPCEIRLVVISQGKHDPGNKPGKYKFTFLKDHWVDKHNAVSLLLQTDS